MRKSKKQIEMEQELMEKERLEKEKQENIEKLADVIKNKKKVSSTGANAIKKKIFENLVIAILCVIYFYVVLQCSQSFETLSFLFYLKIASGILLGLSIIIFEISYRNDNDSLAIHGIEILIVAIISLFIIYLYSLFVNRTFVTIIISISFISTIYFIIKSVIIWYKSKKKDVNVRDDIKDIVKD